MAERNSPVDDAQTSGGWWGSWLSSAKSKSAEVYTMVRKDLDEIGSAVKSEASHVYNATSTVIEKTLKLDEPASTANTMKKSITTFLGSVSNALNPEPDDDDTEVILSSNGDTTVLATYKKELEALQRLDATFLVPADSPEYDAWRLSLDEADRMPSASVVGRRLRSDPLLAAQYDKLVPSAVTDQLFWERYLFRAALLHDRLAGAVRRAGGGGGVEEPVADPVLAHMPLQIELEARASAEVTVPSPMSSPEKLSRSESKTTSDSLEALSEQDEGVAWEEDDFGSDVELTEEQQTLLLQEYEKEIANKKQIKQSSSKDLSNNNKNKLDYSKSSTQTVKKPDSRSSKGVSKQASSTSNNNSEKIENDSSNVASNPSNVASKPSNIANKSSNVASKASNVVSKNSKNTVNPKLSKNSNAKVIEKASVASQKAKPIGSQSDVCGNNLVEDHFKDEAKVKDDASSNSDESWEKEFEIDEPAA